MWPNGKQIMIPINSQKYSDQNLDIIKVVAFVQNKLRRPMTQIFFLYLLGSKHNKLWGLPAANDGGLSLPAICYANIWPHPQ